MVTDLQNIRVKVDVFIQKALFGFSARVAGKEHAKALVLQNKCDRVVVDVVLRAADDRSASTNSRRTAVRCPRTRQRGTLASPEQNPQRGRIKSFGHTTEQASRGVRT